MINQCRFKSQVPIFQMFILENHLWYSMSPKSEIHLFKSNQAKTTVPHLKSKEHKTITINVIYTNIIDMSIKISKVLIVNTTIIICLILENVIDP